MEIVPEVSSDKYGQLIELFPDWPGNLVQFTSGDVADPEIAAWCGRNAFLQAMFLNAPDAYDGLVKLTQDVMMRSVSKYRLQSPPEEVVRENLEELESKFARYGVGVYWLAGIMCMKWLDIFVQGYREHHSLPLAPNAWPVTAGVSPPLAFMIVEPFLRPPDMPSVRNLICNLNPVQSRKADVLKAFNDAYHTDLKALGRLPRHRNFDHFVWLVQYQVLGRSKNTIGPDIDIDKHRTTVDKAINAVAALIDLPLRPERNQRAA